MTNRINNSVPNKCTIWGKSYQIGNYWIKHAVWKLSFSHKILVKQSVCCYFQIEDCFFDLITYYVVGVLSELKK